MAQDDADTVIMLSSELIAEVMEGYFNKQMFKRQVKIVDLKPTETGYAFSLAFVADTRLGNGKMAKVMVNPAAVQRDGQVFVPLVDTRDDKGRFTKRKVS